MWLLLVINCQVMVHECIMHKRVFSDEDVCQREYKTAMDREKDYPRFIVIPCRRV